MTQKVIIYGARGALGSAAVQAFKNLNYWILAIDVELDGQHESLADKSIHISKNHSESLIAQEKQVLDEAHSVLIGSKVDAILCVAGGWAGGGLDSGDMAKNAEMMLRSSVWPAIICSRLAGLHLNDDGLIVLTGAKAALSSTPSMIGYGLAKAAVHQLTKSTAAGLPSTATSLAILPEVLNTPMNRKWMPNVDQTKWTSLDTVTSLFTMWAAKKDLPKSGSLITLDAQTYNVVV